MNTMKAVVVEGVGNVRIRDIEMPECGEKDIILGTKRCGICSTDFVRTQKTGFYHYPVVPGHEFCGVVVEKGDKVRNAEIGERVAVYPLIPCKACMYCKSGNYNLCDNYNFLGSRTNGGFAEFVRCPSENMVRLPDEVSFDEGSMIEPASVALHANKLAGRGNAVVVLGLGPIGQMTLQWAKIFGAETVVGVDRHDDRIAIAKKLGVDHVIDTRNVTATEALGEITRGAGADVVFECSGSEELQKLGIRCASKRGKVIVVGNPMGDLLTEKDLFSRIVRREILITGSWSSLTANKEWDESVRYIKDKRIHALPVITHKVHLGDGERILDDMFNKRFEFCKVVFNI